MNMPPELFAQRPIRSDYGRKPYRKRRITTILVLSLLVVGGGYALFGKSSPPSPEEIPTVKSEGAWKQRPEQPGGADIPHQDVQVYQALEGNDGVKPQVEHLLPPPETPQQPAVAAPAPNVISGPQMETFAAPKAEVPETSTPVTPSKPESPAPQPVQAAPAKPPAAVKTESLVAKGESKGNYRVQLASLPDEAAARSMMTKLQSKYASVLGDLHLQTMRADLGTKGIYYRIQSPKISEDRATQICNELKSLKAGCFLVRP